MNELMRCWRLGRRPIRPRQPAAGPRPPGVPCTTPSRQVQGHEGCCPDRPGTRPTIRTPSSAVDILGNCASSTDDGGQHRLLPQDAGDPWHARTSSRSTTTCPRTSAAGRRLALHDLALLRTTPIGRPAVPRCRPGPASPRFIEFGGGSPRGHEQPVRVPNSDAVGQAFAVDAAVVVRRAPGARSPSSAHGPSRGCAIARPRSCPRTSWRRSALGSLRVLAEIGMDSWTSRRVTSCRAAGRDSRTSSGSGSRRRW